jgi:hypothetical protein
MSVPAVLLPGGDKEQRMTMHVMVSLPDAVYRSAARLAQLTHRDIGDILTDTLALSLPALPDTGDAVVPITELSDAEVLSMANLELPPAQDRRLSLLLERQQAGTLSTGDQADLRLLMQAYHEGLLRKAQGLHEAVRRGLREPLAP